MRKLVSIQRIKDIAPIENADAIEVAKILGWNVVIKKGEFSAGDLVVYAEIDSVFPDREEFSFLKDKKFRIRTIRLRGQISQGICFPLSILPPGNYQEGEEVTDLIGVIKYEAPIPPNMEGITKSDFPVFISKTEEQRIQTIPDTLAKEKGLLCVCTEKLDGWSTTVYLNDGEFGVCSKNIELCETSDSPYWKVARKYHLEEILRQLDRNLALQGETIGSGVMGNKYELPENEFDWYLFNIFDIDEYRYLEFEEMIVIAKKFGLKVVPVVDDKFYLIDDVERIVSLSKGKSLINPKIHREGIVIKSIHRKKNGETISMKTINPDFLIKYQED